MVALLEEQRNASQVALEPDAAREIAAALAAPRIGPVERAFRQIVERDRGPSRLAFFHSAIAIVPTCSYARC